MKQKGTRCIPQTALIIAIAIMLSAVMAGCARPVTDEGGITITDMKNRVVTLEAPATKVVALTAADCEIIYALGAGDTLVGRGEYCNYPAEVLSVTSVQSGSETNVEQLIALQPQVVFMATMNQTLEQVEQLENAGIRVVTSEAVDVEGVYYAIKMIGALVGKSEAAEALVGSMQSAFSEIRQNSTGDGTKTVYFEVSPLQWGLWTAGKDTFMDEVANMLGVKNCFGDVTGWAEVSEEEVLLRNPDYIVTIAMSSGEGATPIEEILARSGWENVAAVRNNAILHMPNDELSRPGPRLTDGARMLFELIYPAN